MHPSSRSISGVVLASLVGFLYVPCPTDASEAAIDRRKTMSFEGASPTSVQLDRIVALRESLGGSLVAAFDPATGVTRSLMNPTGKLTKPSSGAPLDVAVDFVRANSDLLGLRPTDLNEIDICDQVYSRITETTHIYLCQKFYGIRIFNAQLQVHVGGDGAIIGISNAFVPRLEDLLRTDRASRVAREARAVGVDDFGSLAPAIDAVTATSAAGRHLGAGPRRRARVTKGPSGANLAQTLRASELSDEPVEAKLLWLPMGRGLTLVWNLRVHTNDSRHVHDLNVDATGGLEPDDSGRVITRFDLVSDSQYQVYPLPVESPNHTSPLPPQDARILVVGGADPIASPLGWHDNGGQTFATMRGNNVHAYDDANDDNAPPASEPTCPGGNCSFPLSLSADPTTYTNAAIANVFYWTNRIHDVQYRYGFDEVAGNFQVNNFGLGGAGSDDLRAEVQDGGGLNNANFLTLSDGTRPRMQMFLWNQTNPRRDGSLDAGIIVHEYGHGISTRQVGGPANVLCLFNDQQPGEGLSDWWALVYTARPGDTPEMPRGIATYVLGDPADGDGIRTQRYSTDDSVNDHTYESINGMAVPHGVGEVWAQAAWEVYWRLVEQYGFDPDLANATGGAGNQRMMLYVNEGMKFTACSPTFTDVRDGIIQAAVNLHGGEDVCTLWQGFADFGLGVDAVSGGPSSTTPTNGFDIPANCQPGPRMLEPEPYSTLPGSDVTFAWESNGVAVEEYELWVGTSPGTSNLFESGSLGTSLTVQVEGLPRNGSTLYVRLRYRLGGSWSFKDFSYKAPVSDPAMVSPPPGTELPGAEVTFEWASNGTNVSSYWLFVGTSVGGSQLFNSGSMSVATTSKVVAGLPTDGSPVHVRLWWLLQGSWKKIDYNYTAWQLPRPALVVPAPGSQLPGAGVTFSWTSDGLPVTHWELWVSSTPGGQELFSSGVTTALSAPVNGLPRDGRTIYARLRFQLDGAWDFEDFQYTADLGAPTMTAPPPGSELSGASALFEWTADGAPVNAWWLYVGSSLGGRDIHDSGNLGAALSRSVSGIPTDGRDLYVRLWHRMALTWTFTDFQYAASPDGGGSEGTPTLTSPSPGSVLPGPTVTFQWEANGAPVTNWWVYIGTTAGSNNVFNSGNLGSTTTSIPVTGLPTNGQDLHLKLFYLLNGAWQSTLFVFPTQNLAPAMTSPAPGTILPGTNVTFSWQAHPDGAPVVDWWLYVGTAQGSTNLFNSGPLGAGATTKSVSGIPTDGRTIYVRLNYKMGGTWSFVDFVFTAANLGRPTITSPIPGSVLPGASVNFTWASAPSGQSPAAWWLQVGSSPGAKNYLDSGNLGATQSLTVSGLPVNGSTIYVRLWYLVNFKWEYSDFVFIAAGP
ncbi:MAG TPA: extracellular metalloproteinase [Vicinamibacteria bacterium]|nr:extracellular metalloproteinase [Vicinamibacteria bacterium]